MRFMKDADGYWDAYKDVQNQIFEELKPDPAFIVVSRKPVNEDLPHFRCVYCRERFDALEQLQAHYTKNQVGADPTLIPPSRRGYSEDAWRRGQAIINAPTIKSVVG